MTKIIHIAHGSRSKSTGNIKGLCNDWHHKVAKSIQQNSKNLNIECWRPEVKYKENKIIKYKGILHRIFKCELSLYFSKEISFSMLKELRKLSYKKKIIIHLHEYYSWHGIIIPYIVHPQTIIIGQNHGAVNPLKQIKRRNILKLFPFISIIEEILIRKSLKKYNLIGTTNNIDLDYLKSINIKRCVFMVVGVDNALINSKISLNDSIKYFKSVHNYTKNSNKIFLYVGEVKGNKGINELLDSFCILKRSLSYKYCDLFIVGNHNFNNDKVNRLRTFYNIHLVNYISHDKLIHFYNVCDIYVHPSYTEGASVSIMEAYSLGIPIITTDTGNVKDFIVHGKNGFIVKKKSVDSLFTKMVKSLNYKFESKHNNKYSMDVLSKKIIKYYKDF